MGVARRDRSAKRRSCITSSPALAIVEGTLHDGGRVAVCPSEWLHMREFAFFGTWKDSWAVLEAIEQLGMFWMVPDLWYERPEPLLYQHVDDSLKGMLTERRRLFLWSAAFASEFPPLREGSGATRGRYRVPTAIGVPLLQLVVPPCYEKDGVRNVGARRSHRLVRCDQSGHTARGTSRGAARCIRPRSLTFEAGSNPAQVEDMDLDRTGGATTAAAATGAYYGAKCVTR